MLGNRLLDEARCERSVLAFGQQPADDAAAVDVDDDVEVQVDELRLRQQFRDVPGPDLIWSRRQEFRLGMARMDPLVAPLSGLPTLLEQPVKGALRANVAVLLGERRHNLSRSTVLKARLVQGVQGGLLLLGRQGSNRLPSARRQPGLLPSIVSSRMRTEG